MTTPKWVHNKIQPIAIDDVLHYLAEAATADVPASRTWDVGGPDVMEYGDAMQVYADVAGLAPAVDHRAAVPDAHDRQLVGGPGDADPSGLARPLVESLECDAVMLDPDIDTVVAPPPAA